MAGRMRVVDLIWPAGGEYSAAAYQRQPPYTCARALNVRTRETIEGRERGGRRPGLSKAFTTQLGSGAKVNLINQCRDASAGELTIFDHFTYSAFPATWSTASWAGGSPSLAPTASPTKLSSALAPTVEAGIVYESVSDIDVASPYDLSFLISSGDGATQYADYFVYLRMDATTPNARSAGVVVSFEGDSNAGHLTIRPIIRVYVGGSLDGTYTMTSWIDADMTLDVIPAQVHVDGSVITIYVNGTSSGSQDIAAHGAAAGTRFGIGCATTDASIGIPYIDTFLFSYVSDTGSVAARLWTLAAANGTLYREKSNGTEFAATSGSSTLNPSVTLGSVEHLGKLYIADYEDQPNIEKTDATVTTDQLESATVSDWTLYADADDDLVEIVDQSVPGVYGISSVAAGAVTLASSPGDDTGVTVRITRAPKVWDSATNTISIWNATSGTIPLGCPLICRFMGGIVLAGQADYPHIAYHSASGDPLDFDTGSTSPTGAYATTLAATDVIAQPIKALIPFMDDFLIYGCSTQIWMQRGSLRLGGSIVNISRNVGVFSATSWCWTPGGELVFMSNGDGLYRLSPGGMPEPLSRERIPLELLNIDPNSVTVSMAWDFASRGVEIKLTVDGGNRTHWFYHMKYGAFWREVYPTSMQPTSIMSNAIINDRSVTLLGGYDGYVRKPDDEASTDDGEQITSRVSFGPIRLGRNDFEGGEINRLVGKVARGSVDVNWSAYVGESAEDAAPNNYGDQFVRTDEAGEVRMTEDGFARTEEQAPGGTWTAGRNYEDFVNARGGAAIIEVSGPNSGSWAIESAGAMLIDGGIAKL